MGRESGDVIGAGVDCFGCDCHDGLNVAQRESDMLHFACALSFCLSMMGSLDGCPRPRVVDGRLLPCKEINSEPM